MQRSIIQPVRAGPPPYRRLGFTLNATGIGGRVLSWDDFGGLESYLELLDYCAASADEAAENGTERDRVVLPDYRSSLEYGGGVIGAPAPAPADPLPSSPPADYSADAPSVPPAPETPAALPGPAPSSPPPAPAPLSPDAAPSTAAPVIVAPDAADNPVDRFVAECCETGADQRILAGELYAGFVQWRRNAGEEPSSQRAFGMRLTRLGLIRKRRGHGKHWWEGIRLAGTP